MWRKIINRCARPIRVEILKSKARDHHNAHTYARMEWRMAKCVGASDADDLGREVARYRVEFNETMDRLAAIDPNAPKYRIGNWIPN